MAGHRAQTKFSELHKERGRIKYAKDYTKKRKDEHCSLEGDISIVALILGRQPSGAGDLAACL